MAMQEIQECQKCGKQTSAFSQPCLSCTSSAAACSAPLSLSAALGEGNAFDTLRKFSSMSPQPESAAIMHVLARADMAEDANDHAVSAHAPSLESKSNCETCGHPWLEHEFAVPAPYCPGPPLATLPAHAPLRQPLGSALVRARKDARRDAAFQELEKLRSQAIRSRVEDLLALYWAPGNVAAPPAAREAFGDAICNYIQGFDRPTPMMADNAALVALGRRALWLAYTWNDHNFGPAHKEARLEAEKWGIRSQEDATAFIDKLDALQGDKNYD